MALYNDNDEGFYNNLNDKIVSYIVNGYKWKGYEEIK